MCIMSFHRVFVCVMPTVLFRVARMDASKTPPEIWTVFVLSFWVSV